MSDCEPGNSTVELPFDPATVLGLDGNKLEISRVVGHCMAPAIQHHDVVFLKKQQPKHGDVVIAKVDGFYMIKRYLVIDGKPRLRPDNPAHREPLWKREMKVSRVVVATFRKINPPARFDSPPE